MRIVHSTPAILVAALILAPTLRAPAAEPAPQPISFERQVLEFAPTRPDFTVGIAWFTVLTPQKDWTVTFDEPQHDNFDERGDLKYLELKQVGKNRFELPALAIKPAGPDSGAVCMSVKIWFNELPNERLFFFPHIEDRYSQLSYCSRDAPEAQHHFSQNRVATLEDFRARLKQPLVLTLTEDHLLWRPTLLVDDQGAAYFHSLLVGRTSFAWGAGHHTNVWKLAPDGSLQQFPNPKNMTRQTWLNLARKLPDDRFATEVVLALDRALASDRSNNLYFEQATQQDPQSPQFFQLARLDAQGNQSIVAGSTRGHRDGPAKEAQFARITALAVGPGGEIYVADGAPDSGSWIRRIAPDGAVTTLAGSNKLGFADGKGEAARFYCPSALALDASGNLYAADWFNGRIRKITPDGTVTTVAGQDPADPPTDDSLIQPSGVAVGPAGDLYILEGAQKIARVRKLSRDGKLTTLVAVDLKTAMEAPPAAQ